MQQLDHLTELLAAATAGPWIADSHEIHQLLPGTSDVRGEWIGETCRVEGDPLHATTETDADLIVALVNAAPALLATVRRQKAALDAVTELHKPVEYRGDSWCDHCGDPGYGGFLYPCATVRTALASPAPTEATT